MRVAGTWGRYPKSATAQVISAATSQGRQERRRGARG
jgi:hypothetical protein